MIQKLEHSVVGTDYGCGGASFSEVIDKVNEVIDYINSQPEGFPPYQTGFKGHPDPPGVSDLEGAAEEYASKTLCDPDDGPSVGLAKDAFIAGANYQHCKEAKGYPDPAGVKKDPSIDAGIDLYFYGKFFRYDRKPDAVYVYPTPGTSYPGIPVEDWMEGHTVMNPSKLRAFAKYFYDRGKESKDNQK